MKLVIIVCLILAVGFAQTQQVETGTKYTGLTKSPIKSTQVHEKEHANKSAKHERRRKHKKKHNADDGNEVDDEHIHEKQIYSKNHRGGSESKLMEWADDFLAQIPFPDPHAPKMTYGNGVYGVSLGIGNFVHEIFRLIRHLAKRFAVPFINNMALPFVRANIAPLAKDVAAPVAGEMMRIFTGENAENADS